MQCPFLEKTRILVVGDVMLDTYWKGSTSRISPEAPVPVVQIHEMEERPGGAANVALNIAVLGGHSVLLGMCGDDSAAEILENKLRAAKIDCRLQRLSEMATTKKLRVLSQHQQLIRLDFEENHQSLDYKPLLAIFISLLSQVDLVILSDYGKGVLRCAPALIKAARHANVPVLVDPKGKDFSVYQHANLITPNRKEFEDVVGFCIDEADLVTKGFTLLKQYNIDALLITRGEHGMTLLCPGEEALHLPAKTREVYDVTGAGDTVIAMLATALAAGSTLLEAAKLANIAASIVVGKLGAATVTVSELQKAIAAETIIGRGILSEDQLVIACETARLHGQKIVMTNGCFDILHPGHVAYLEQAKALGDRLIVAVNDDISVAKLKGTDRPINSLTKRMAVLAALRAVDWVVAFSEDTPERLLARVLPDILVKGGDCLLHQIVGADFVQSYGGEVYSLVLESGCSTSAIVEKIRTI